MHTHTKTFLNINGKLTISLWFFKCFSFVKWALSYVEFCVFACQSALRTTLQAQTQMQTACGFRFQLPAPSPAASGPEFFPLFLHLEWRNEGISLAVLLWGSNLVESTVQGLECSMCIHVNFSTWGTNEVFEVWVCGGSISFPQFPKVELRLTSVAESNSFPSGCWSSITLISYEGCLAIFCFFWRRRKHWSLINLIFQALTFWSPGLGTCAQRKSRWKTYGRTSEKGLHLLFSHKICLYNNLKSRLGICTHMHACAHTHPTRNLPSHPSRMFKHFAFKGHGSWRFLNQSPLLCLSPQEFTVNPTKTPVLTSAAWTEAPVTVKA